MTIADGSKMRCDLTAIVRRDYSPTKDTWVIAFKPTWKSPVNNNCTTWVIVESIDGQSLGQIIDSDKCEYEYVRFINFQIPLI